MKPWPGLTIGIFVLFLVLLLSFGRMLGEFSGGVRWLHDPGELSVYDERSAWWERGTVPYTSSSPQEYPQLALSLLTLPKMLGWNNLTEYIAGFYFLNFLFFVFFLFVTSRIQLVLNGRSWVLSLTLLPGFLYFSFNRFDLWMVVFVLAAILALWKKQDRLSLLLLAIATMTKWVPLLLLPLFLLWLKLNKRSLFSPLCWFALGLLPFFIWTWTTAGFEGLGFALGFHLNRSMEWGSMPAVIAGLLHVEFGSKLETLLIQGLWLLQLGLPFLIIAFLAYQAFKKQSSTRIEHLFGSPHRFLFVCSLVLTLFSFFNRFYSPQWWLWTAGLILPLLQQKKELALFLVLDLIHYLIFPIVFDALGPNHPISLLLHLGRAILIIALFMVLARRLWSKRTFLQPTIHPASTERDG